MKLKIFSLIILHVFLLTSCSYKDVKTFQDHNSIISNHYDAHVQSFLMSENKLKLVVVDDKYHYIFSLDNKLRDILEWKNKKSITPYFDNFKVDLKNNISGNYTLECYCANPNQEEELKQFNFLKDPVKRHQGIRYYYEGNIKGIRYLAKEPLPSQYIFEKQYLIKVTEELSTLEKSTNIAMTPIMFTGNTITSVTKLGLVILMLVPMIFVLK